jgi:hypothetical protein
MCDAFKFDHWLFLRQKHGFYAMLATVFSFYATNTWMADVCLLQHGNNIGQIGLRKRVFDWRDGLLRHAFDLPKLRRTV